MEIPQYEMTDPVPVSIIPVLSGSLEVKDNKAVLKCGQLDRNVYAAIDDLFKRLGGKWNTKQQAHIFPYPPAPIISDVLDTRLMPAKNPLAFFPTPEREVKLLMTALEPDGWVHTDWQWLEESGRTYRFLEPSAGRGAIANGFINAGVPKHLIDCCELDCYNASILRRQGFNVFMDDFLNYETEQRYDFIAMNPPFSIEGDRQAWLTHVEYAYGLLADDGKLAAITPLFYFQKDKRATGFLDFVERYGWWEELERGAFKSSGTNVKTAIVFLEKMYSAEQEKLSTEECDAYRNWYSYQYFLCHDSEREMLSKREKLFQEIKARPLESQILCEAYIRDSKPFMRQLGYSLSFDNNDVPKIAGDMMDYYKDWEGADAS